MPDGYRERVAARAIVFDKNGHIALQHITKRNYHKLPGGGVEAGEDIAMGLTRELAEEIGCVVEEVRDLGVVEEFRDKQGLHQVSHCFVASVAGEKGVPNPDEGEVADGAEAVWMTLESATQTLEDEVARVENYTEKFMCLRDLTFLREAKRISGS